MADITRRTVLRGAGAAAAATAAATGVAACGNASAPAPAASGPGGTTPAGAPGVLAKVADVPVGGGVVIDKVVLTQPTAGTIKAFSAVCTHQGCTVSKVENSRIVCPCHDSVFDAATGAVLGGPAKAPLPSRAVTVANGSITLG